MGWRSKGEGVGGKKGHILAKLHIYKMKFLIDLVDTQGHAKLIPGFSSLAVIFNPGVKVYCWFLVNPQI